MVKNGQSQIWFCPFIILCNNLRRESTVPPLIVSEFILIKTETRYENSLIVLIEEEPRITERIGIANYVHLACWRVSLHTHDSHFARFTPCHIGYEYGVSQFVARTGSIDKYIAWLDILYASHLSLMIHREGARVTIHATHISFEGFLRTATCVVLLLAIHISETDFAIAAMRPEIVGTEMHGHISTLFVVGEDRLVNYSSGEKLIVGITTCVQLYLGTSCLERERSEILSITAGRGLNPCISSGSSNFAKSTGVPRIACLSRLPAPSTHQRNESNHDNDCEKYLFLHIHYLLLAICPNHYILTFAFDKVAQVCHPSR